MSHMGRPWPFGAGSLRSWPADACSSSSLSENACSSGSSLQVASSSRSGLIEHAGPSRLDIESAGPSRPDIDSPGPSRIHAENAGPSVPENVLSCDAEDAGPSHVDTEDAGASDSGPDDTCSSQERRGRGRSRGSGRPRGRPRGSGCPLGSGRPRYIGAHPPADTVRASLRSPSPIRESDLVTRTTGEWVLALSSAVDIANETYFNPNCECGGGSYLGSIHTITMYENHRSIDCIVHPKKRFIPYLSPTYFNALKVFESVINDANINYETKVFNLIQTWDNCDNILCSDPCTGTHVFIHYAASESAILILDPEWDKIPKEITSDFTRVINKILHTLQEMKCHLETVKSCYFLLSIIEDPWNHHFLPKLLYGYPSQDEVVDFIQFEKSNIFALRLKILCEGNCESQALQLSYLAINAYKTQMKSKLLFGEQDFEFIRDIYFGCLERLNKKEELVSQLEEFISLNNCKTLMRRYSSKIQSLSNIPKKERPRICKNVVLVCEMAACVIVVHSLIDPGLYNEFHNLIMLWSNIMLTLMDSDLKLDVNNKSLKEMIRKFIELAPTASHLYTFYQIINEKFGSTFPLTLYLEIYIQALTNTINEKKYNRQMADTKLSFNSLTELTQGYLKLANLLKDVVIVCRECVLTAYSLMPSKDLMIQIENLAIKSGKLCPEDSTGVSVNNSCDKSKNESTMNSTPVVSNTQRKRKSKFNKPEPEPKMIDYNRDDSYTKIRSALDNLPEPLSPIMQDNLISVIKYPRYGSFNWDLDWPEMKLRCQRYLDNIDGIILRNMLRRENLKYLDIDIDEYNKRTLIKMKKLTNNKGYFSTDDSSDDEVSAASSGEMVSYRDLHSRKRPRKRKVRPRKRKVVKRKQLKANIHKKSKIGPPKKSKFTNLPRRQNLRSQKSFEVTDESTVGSLLNDETKDNSQISSNKVEDNVNTVLKKNDGVKKKYKSLEKVLREKRVINKNHHKDFDYSWCSKKGKLNKNNKSLVSEEKELNKSKSDNFHLNMLSERIPQLSSLDFMMPASTDHIVNVVQIQTTSNTLTNVSQTQTEHVSNHSNNEIEKKTNDNQTNTNPLDSYVSLYQSNSRNNSSGAHQGECSFTGSVSVSNQRITTDSMTNVQNIGSQGTIKSLDSNDVLVDQNQINLDHRWNDIQLQNSGERLQPTSENSVHLSSNVIVRTSDVISPSNVPQTSGNVTSTNKKVTTYCVKSRDRLIDFTLPTSISSISTNNNRATNIPVVMHSNKLNFDPKSQQNSPVQTSVGLQVNFSNQQSEVIQSMVSPNNQPQMCSNISENPTSTNMSALNDQIINSRNNTSSVVNPTFIKENNAFDNLKSNVSLINPVSSIQTQTCIGLRSSNEVSDPNSSVISLMIASTQSQVIKTNVPNSLYTSSPNKRIQLTELSHTSQTNRPDEQKKIDNMKLVSQTFTATSEAIKFVTSNSESQHLIQSTDKNNSSNLAIFQNVTEGVSSISQENDSNAKSSNRVRGNMRTYESKTRALKQANMSDMFVFEKGTLYAVQDDVNQLEPAKTVVSPKNISTNNLKIQNKQTKELLDKPKPSPNITITGSMLPRFQQVFGKTKFQSSNIINDTSSLCSSSVASIPSSNSGPIVNRTIVSTSRVYSSSKGVQTNHDVDPISSNAINNVPSKGLENKLQHNISMTKSNSALTVGNNKNNVIMTCKTVSSVKNVPQVSASSNHQLLNSNIDANNTVKKEATSMSSSSKVSSFTTSSNSSSVASSSSNLIYSIPLQSDTKVSNVEKPSQGITQIQRQLKVSPSIIQTVLRKHPTWQQTCFRQGKQSTEVQTTVERLIPANITNIIKTTVESANHKVSISTSKSNVTEPNVSSSMMEQVREFESVLEEVRKTSLMNEMSTVNMLPQINHEIIQIHSPSENVDLLNTDNNQTLFPLNKKPNVNNERERCSFSFLNQPLSNDLASEEKEPVPSTIISVSSVTPTPSVTSPNNNLSVSPVDGSTQCSKQIANKAKPVIKTPASSPSTSAVKVPVLQKPLPKLQEDEQTTQRIYAILDKYAEQLRNSPELKNKPAPRRRTNPPTNPSLNAKRKKSNQLNLKTCSQQTSCSSSGMEMSPTSDMQAIDSEDSSNAVSHFSHIINSPPRNPDDQTTATVISETPLIENTLINVNDVIKKINVDAEMKSKVSQSTQIVVSGTSGSFLSIPEGTTGNVRLLVASGNNQKMYRLHCPVTGPGPVLFHQITAKDSCSNDVKMSSNILGQNMNESAILSAITTDDLQVPNSGLGNEILLNTSQNSTVFEHKINKPDIILESMEKAQVLDNNEKPLTFPVMKKNQASQSTFSVIHTLPSKPKSESNDHKELLLSNSQNSISENIQKKVSDIEQNNSNTIQELVKNSKIDQIGHKQEKLNKTLNEESSYMQPESSNSSSTPFEEMEFTSFHSQKREGNNQKKIQQTVTKLDEKKFESTNTNQISIDCINDSKLSNSSNNLHSVKPEKKAIMIKQDKSSNITNENSSNILKISNSEKEELNENKPNVVLSDVAAAASAAEIISTANQTYKQKEELSPKTVKTECESENENENTLSNTVYNLLDNQSAAGMNTKIGSLTIRLKNDRSAKNWNKCLSKIMPPGTEKMFESENLKQLQESFQYTQIKTFKDLKMFVFEQCKKFDNNVETPKEYDLYDDIDGLGVDKPSTNELFPEVAILNDLDKSVSPTLGLLQASTSKSNDTSALQAKRKSVLSHTTTSTVISTGEQTNIISKKTKNKVSFLKQALYNEMNQDSNDGETKSYINGSTKTAFDSTEQIDSCPESPLNINTVDSETCMSEDSTSTISSGTPHYNFRKSKRKNIEEDGFIESQVIKRMYRGRTSEDNDEKSEPPKINNLRTQISEQKSNAEKKESNHRRISNRLKNNNVKNNQHLSNKSSQLDSPPYKNTTTRSSLRRVSRKTT